MKSQNGYVLYVGARNPHESAQRFFSALPTAGDIQSLANAGEIGARLARAVACHGLPDVGNVIEAENFVILLEQVTLYDPAAALRREPQRQRAITRESVLSRCHAALTRAESDSQEGAEILTDVLLELACAK